MKMNKNGKNNPFYGKKHSEETKLKIGLASSGRIPWNKGKKLSLETRLKISKNHARLSGVNNPNYGKAGYMLGKKLSLERREKLSESRKGNKNPAWIDGRSYFPYPPIFNETLRKFIRNRDNFLCQNCFMNNEEHKNIYKRSIHVHHIDYNPNNCNVRNLITLCQGCNLKANYNREKWKQLYENKINNIYIK